MCWHQWGKWSKLFSQNVSTDTSLKQQARKCVKCNRVQLRYVLCSAYTAADDINTATNHNNLSIQINSTGIEAVSAAFKKLGTAMGNVGKTFGKKTTMTNDAMFEQCTKTECKNGRFEITCVLGLWAVSGPELHRVRREAKHYWQQYLSDGEYDRILE